MWERLHVQITGGQMRFLRAESYTRGKSLGGIIRMMIEREIESHRNKNGESTNYTPKPRTDTK
jgi:hypothetical protein